MRVRSCTVDVEGTRRVSKKSMLAIVLALAALLMYFSVFVKYGN